MLVYPSKGMAFAVGKYGKATTNLANCWESYVLTNCRSTSPAPGLVSSKTFGLGRERQCALRRSNHAPFLDSPGFPGYVPDRAGVGRTPRRLVFWPHLRAGMKRQNRND